MLMAMEAISTSASSDLIRAARVEKYRGLVFASLSPEVEKLTDYLAGAKYYIDLFMDFSPEGAVEDPLRNP